VSVLMVGPPFRCPPLLVRCPRNGPASGWARPCAAPAAGGAPLRPYGTASCSASERFAMTVSWRWGTLPACRSRRARWKRAPQSSGPLIRHLGGLQMQYRCLLRCANGGSERVRLLPSRALSIGRARAARKWIALRLRVLHTPPPSGPRGIGLPVASTHPARHLTGAARPARSDPLKRVTTNRRKWIGLHCACELCTPPHRHPP
jgi:hypothetical protein